MVMARKRLIQVSGGVVLVIVIAVALGAQYLQQAANAGAGGTNHPVAKTNIPAGSTAISHDERRPVGDWKRTVGPFRVALKFTEERLLGTVACNVEGKVAKIDFSADYSVTRDGVLYGVVIGGNITAGGEEKDPQKMLEGYAKLGKLLLDQPFSMRYRVDGNVLMLKDVRICVQPDGSGDDFQKIGSLISSLGSGQYTRKVVTSRSATHSP
jgi:hypothetical protein